MLYVLQKQSPKVFYKNGVLKNFTKFIGKKNVPENTSMPLLLTEKKLLKVLKTSVHSVQIERK